jgi:hypothetical protein
VPKIALKNIRKVTFTVYVTEGQSSYLESQLNNFYDNGVLSLCGRTLTVEPVTEENRDTADALTFFEEVFG